MATRAPHTVRAKMHRCIQSHHDLVHLDPRHEDNGRSWITCIRAKIHRCMVTKGLSAPSTKVYRCKSTKRPQNTESQGPQSLHYSIMDVYRTGSD
eukprot:1161486-Pelagomonas_calceolata.AAC.4